MLVLEVLVDAHGFNKHAATKTEFSLKQSRRASDQRCSILQSALDLPSDAFLFHIIYRIFYRKS
jgi:hypothetical protein